MGFGNAEVDDAFGSLQNKMDVPTGPDEVLLCGILSELPDAETASAPEPESVQPGSSTDRVDGVDAVTEMDGVTSSGSASGGPVSLVVEQPAAAAAASSSSSRSSSRLLQQPRAIREVSGFACILCERRFTMPNGAIVLLKSGVNAGSTGNIASVYQDPDCTIVLGHLGTAAPLGETEGLKASCSQHSRKGYRCQCWIRFQKDYDVTDSVRLDLFRSLADWLSESATLSETEHDENSFNLRLAANMNPRKRKATTK